MLKFSPIGWICVMLFAVSLSAQQQSEPGSQPQQDRDGKKQKDSPKDPLEKINRTLGDLRKLPEDQVWVDIKKKIVVIDGEICLRKGPLEMFACPPHTKEHESIVQAHARSFMVHTALLMVGAKPGKPVEWEPKYKPANGTRVEIMVHWLDKDGKHVKRRAQEMIRNVKTGKPMKAEWVFAGSEFYLNPNTKVRHYLADGGEMICVSNFTTAMMDLPIESTQSKEGLIFEALTDNIPPLKTPVRIVLKPVIEKEPKKKSPNKEKKPEIG